MKKKLTPNPTPNTELKLKLELSKADINRAFRAVQKERIHYEGMCGLHPYYDMKAELNALRTLEGNLFDPIRPL